MILLFLVADISRGGAYTGKRTPREKKEAKNESPAENKMALKYNLKKKKKKKDKLLVPPGIYAPMNQIKDIICNIDDAIVNI